MRMGRFEHLPENIVLCGLRARRHHGTKTGPLVRTTVTGLLSSVATSGVTLPMASHGALWRRYNRPRVRPPAVDLAMQILFYVYNALLVV